MRLYYFKSESGNFGDDLNPWLWQRLLPGLFDDDDDTFFVGIGTLLNHRIPRGGKKIVFGSGAGYGAVPVIDGSWTIHCVRGPLTARALGVSASLALTDPAALISSLQLPAQCRDGGVAFMPHWVSARNADWELICARVGIRYIDSRWPPDRVLAEIARSEILVAEAMHGAIVADALRVPWVPVVCYEHVLSFKWLDWTASLGLDYAPVVLPGVWDAERTLAFSGRLRNTLKRALLRLGASGRNWTPPPRRRSPRKDFERLADEFGRLVGRLSPCLSDERRLTAAVQRLQEKLELVKTAAKSIPRAGKTTAVVSGVPLPAGSAFGKQSPH